MSATTTTNDFPSRPSFPPSFMPSFTLPPSPPPSPTNGFSSIFQSPGGPPLILVCIAAGLLLGAFIGVLLMRRVRPPPAAPRGNGAAAFLSGANQPLGEKPTLLDIHLLPTTAAGIDEEGVEHGTGKEKLREQGAWGRVSPFAAVYLVPSPSPDRPRSRSQSAQSPSATANRSPLSRLMARMPWADSRWRAGAHELSPLSSAQPEAREVQLAVTVSMPSPRHPSYLRLPPLPAAATRTGLGAPHDEENMPDCCIGTVLASYRPAPHTDSNSNGPPAPIPVSPPVNAATS